RETIATGVGAMLLLTGKTILGLPPGGHVELADLIMRSALLLLAAVVVGHVGGDQKKARREALGIAAIVGRADVRMGLKRTMAEVFYAILTWFDAKRAVLVVHEQGSGRVFMWEADRAADSALQTARVTELQADALDRYLFAPVAVAWHAVRRDNARRMRIDLVAI